MPQFPNIKLIDLSGNTTGFQINRVSVAGNTFFVSSVGDVNGDAINDVIASTNNEAYVIFGRAGGFSDALDLATLTGATGFKITNTGGQITSASGAGDVNKDGVQDIIVGSSLDGQVGAGHVIFGQKTSVVGNFAGTIEVSTLAQAKGFKITGVANGDYTGVSVGSAGDVNGDGINDMIIGAPGASTYAGTSYVVFGTTAGFGTEVKLAQLNGTNGFAIKGEVAGDYSGESARAAGDVNGDGVGDIIIGAQGALPNGFNSGAAYVVFGRKVSLVGDFNASVNLSSLSGTNGFQISGKKNDLLGVDVGSGDFNGDGISDLIVGASASLTGTVGTVKIYGGAAYVIFGTKTVPAGEIQVSTLNGNNGFRLTGIGNLDNTGTSVASAGDVNGDGFADMIIGAKEADPFGVSSGVSYVVFGKANGFSATFALSTLNGDNGYRISGEAENSYSGSSVASAGDLNADGIGDLIISSPGANIALGYGGAHVIYGKQGTSNLAPSSLNKTVTTNEDNSYTFKAADFGFTDTDGNTFSAVIITALPANGKLTLSGADVVVGASIAVASLGALVWTPGDDANGVGLGSVSFKVVDSGVGQNTSLAANTLTIDVTAVNDNPELVGPQAVLGAGTENTAYAITTASLLTGYTDVDNLILNVTKLASTQGTFAANGKDWTFTPTGNFSGKVDFTYEVTDGVGGAIAASNSFTLAAVNDAPKLTGFQATLANGTEDVAIDITAANLLLGYSDPDIGDTLSVANLTSLQGTLTANGNGWRFTPNDNYNGTVTLNYNVIDGKGGTVAATNSFTLTAVNDAPLFTPAGKTTFGDGTEDTNYIISLADLKAGYSDVDGDVLNVTNLAANNGTLTANANNTWTFRPTDNFNGTVTLTYKVSDGTLSVDATNSFKLTNTNDAPTLTTAKKTLSNGTEDTNYFITSADLLTGYSDIDVGDTLSVANLAATNGTLVDNANGTWTFTPTKNFNGNVSLTYNVVDNKTGSVAATSGFTLNGVNDAPEALGNKATLADGFEDVAYTITTTALTTGYTDPDQDAMIVTISPVANGTLLDNKDGTWKFTPTDNFSGTVNLNYTISDGKGGSIAAFNSFNLNAVNDAPELTGVPAELATGIKNASYQLSVALLVTGYSDVEGDSISIENLTATNGSLTNDGNGLWTFTPDNDFTGTVELTYDVIDGEGGITAALNNFNVGNTNTAPLPPTTKVALKAGTEDIAYTILLGDLTAGYTDAEGDPLNVTGLTLVNGAVGTLVTDGANKWKFTPTDNFNGKVDITYKVIDGNGGETATTNSFTLAATNDAPTTGTKIVFAASIEDGVRTISASDLLIGFTDVDSALSVTGLTATNGDLINNGNGTWSFTPTPDFNGTVTLNYTVFDGTVGIAASNSFTVTAVNDAPDLTGEKEVFAPGTEDVDYILTSTQLLKGYSDVEGDTLSVSNLAATNGVLVDNNNGTWTFKASNKNFSGLINLDYDVVEGNGGASKATNSFTLAAVNDAPLLTGDITNFAPSDEDKTYEISTIDLLKGYTDSDSNMNVIDLAATNGTLVLNTNGTIWTFTPTKEFSGKVDLTYKVSDGNSTISASNSIMIVAVNDAPELSGQKKSLDDFQQGQTVIINASDLLIGYTDAEGDTISVANLAATNGALVVNPDGISWTFTPTANFSGKIDLTYEVRDTNGGVTQATNSFGLGDINDAPKLTGIMRTFANGLEDGPDSYDISLSDLLQGYTDADGDSLNIANLTATNGTLVANQNGIWNFTPDKNYSGVVTLKYNVTDGRGGETAATNSFTLTAVNDAPELPGGQVALTSGTEDTNYVINAIDLLGGFTDPDIGDILTVKDLTASNGTLIENTDGTWTFTPNHNFNGQVNLGYNVVDKAGDMLAATNSFNLTAVNDAPELTGAKADISAATQNKAYILSSATLLAGYTDAEGDSFNVDNLSATNGALTNNGDGTWTFVPKLDFIGEVALAYNIIDSLGATIAVTNKFDVEPVNYAPVLTEAKAVLVGGTEDTDYIINSVDLLKGFTDVEGNPMAIANLVAGHGTLLDNNNGTWTFTPTDDYNGLVKLNYDVIDGKGGILAVTNSFTLAAVNDTPTTVGIAATPGTEDSLFTYALPAGTFGDVDGETLTLTATLADGGELPSWLKLVSGVFVGVPQNSDVGKISVKVTAADASGILPASSTFDITIANVNDAPVALVIPHQTFNEDALAGFDTFSFFSDVDLGDTLQYSLSSGGSSVLPAWLKIDKDTGKLSGTPINGDVGVTSVKITATDAAGLAASSTFDLKVANINDAPSGTNKARVINEDTATALTADDFGFTDVENNAFQSVIITSLTKGTLTMSTLVGSTLTPVAVKVGDNFAFADISKLSYKALANQFGTNYDSFSFKVVDNGGTDLEGKNTDETPNTLTFNVTDVTDTFTGTARKNTLTGTDGSDVLNGKRGNDTLTGKLGSDTFMFKTGDDKDVIKDFNATNSDVNHDILNIKSLVSVKNWADLLKNHMDQVRRDVVIDGLNGDKITLKNVSLTNLDAGDFIF